ncbi:hypothetical protein L1987_80645 [Smallanthus sonchifolius]|uniref:Uncharacterized protein n=1 Tax=Smallanthus sonchifolius TaxID=185202 RepID=A0ACB8YPF7_9ASTR|nr:hypothetical protein L1987_80645 [Smallanthus sonchifolius]
MHSHIVAYIFVGIYCDVRKKDLWVIVEKEKSRLSRCKNKRRGAVAAAVERLKRNQSLLILNPFEEFFNNPSTS